MPQYMLLIFADPSDGPAQGTPEAEAHMKEWFTLHRGPARVRRVRQR